MRNIINLVIEKDGDSYWGWTTNEGCFSPNTFGTSVDEIKKNVLNLIKWNRNEEPTDETNWLGYDLDSITWEISYNVMALFDEFPFLKISDVAKAAGINPSLMRQYAAGMHNPSIKQAQRIEDALHKLANRLLEVSIV